MSHGSQVARANLLHSKVGEVLGVGEGDLAGELVASAQGRDVCVVGLGLIGGSLLRAAVHAGRSAWGAAASAEAAAAARASGHSASTDLGNALRRAVETDALVVLATPLAALEDVLAEVAHSAPTCRLTDVVSVKKQVARLVAQCSPASRYVGSHPVVAAAASGCNAGSLQLFNGVVWVVETDDEIDLSVWADVAALAFSCGAVVLPATAEEHDVAVARVSQLPYLLASVLASVGANGDGLLRSLTSRSFDDGTRPASDFSELMVAACEANRDALIASMDDALGRLGAARGSLASTGGIDATIRAGHSARDLYERACNNRREITISLRGEPRKVIIDLRQLGRAGVHIVGWSRETLDSLQ
jgi:prephenate dehydrogenase